MKLLFLLCALICALFLSTSLLFADIEIHAYSPKHSWKDRWTVALKDELKKDEYGEKFLQLKIDEEDLQSLSCPGYNQASFEEKKDFWVVFFSALTRAESAFNEKAVSRASRGHRSFGLLQLARVTAKGKCSIISPEKSVLNGEDNLRCGLRLMSWQLLGAPDKSGKNHRPDLVGQLFGKTIFQWGPLRQDDHSGRKLLVDWFTGHLDQLKFCENEVLKQ
jgi:hypothetical protein